IKEIGKRRELPPVDFKQLLTEAGLKAFTEQKRYTNVGGGLDELAGCALLATIRRLNLSMNELTRAHLARLLESPHFPQVRELATGSTKSGPAGARAIAACPRMRHLRKVNFWFGGIGPAGMQAIAGSPHCAGIREMILYANQLGDRGAEALAASPHLRQLEDV